MNIKEVKEKLTNFVVSQGEVNNATKELLESVQKQLDIIIDILRSMKVCDKCGLVFGVEDNRPICKPCDFADTKHHIADANETWKEARNEK